MLSRFYYHWFSSVGCPGGREWVDDQPESAEERTGRDCAGNTVLRTSSFQMSVKGLPEYASELWEAYAGEDEAPRRSARRAFEKWVGPGCRAVSRQIVWTPHPTGPRDEEG